MLFITITLVVSNPDTSSSVKFEQPWNIHSILLTFEVLKPDTSSDVKLEQL